MSSATSLDRIRRTAHKVLELDPHYLNGEEFTILKDCRRVAEKIILIIEGDDPPIRDEHLRARLLYMENRALKELLDKWEAIKNMPPEQEVEYPNTNRGRMSLKGMAVKGPKLGRTATLPPWAKAPLSDADPFAEAAEAVPAPGNPCGEIPLGDAPAPAAPANPIEVLMEIIPEALMKKAAKKRPARRTVSPLDDDL